MKQTSYSADFKRGRQSTIGRLLVWTALLFISLGASVLRAEAPFLDPVTEPLTRALIDEAIAEAKASGDVDVPIPTALLYKGLILFQEEAYKDSMPYLEEALRMDPTLTGAWETLGWAYWRTDQKEKTLRHFQAFLRLMPDRPLPHSMMAQYGILIQDWQMADKHFSKALELNPDQYDLRNWHAQNLLRLGKDAEAQQILEQLIKEDPGRVDIIIILAHLLSFERRYAESSQMWLRVLEELPENANALIALARNQMVLGNLEEADKLCVTALEIKPDSYEALVLRADIADIGDMNSVTLDRLEAVIRATKDPLLRARLRERLATRCHAMNKRTPGTFPPSVILDHLAQAVKEDPKNVFLLTTYAEYCLTFKQYREARKWARIILGTFNRNHLRAKNVYFECALGEGDFDEAEQILHDRYANYDPTDPMRNYHRARLEMMRGRYVEALAQLDEMEAKTSQEAVLTLLYNDLTESDFLAMTSVRRLYEHLFALKQAGFTFLSPVEIPDLLGPEQTENEMLGQGARSSGKNDIDPASVPLPARAVDYLRYVFTAKRKFPPAARRQASEIYARPSKNVAITFDGGLRSAFELGTPVAEDLGVPFGMFITTWRTEYAPLIASWPLIQEYAARGAWIMGSHLHDASRDVPISAETNRLARPLPNRIWLPEKNRVEWMSEWDKRMRDNFRVSLHLLNENLADNASLVPMVAYPYGDIGQEGECNLSVLRSPVQSILAEATRNYDLGFVLDRSGYTCAGANPMLTRRYETAWYDEGSDVVRHAYETHPLFMARTLRIELAQVTGKPHLAEEMLKVLRRDGYPEELIRRINYANRAHFQNRMQRVELPMVVAEAAYGTPPTSALRVSPEGVYAVGPDGELIKPADDGSWYKPSDLSVGAHLYQSQANDEYKVSRVGLRAGLNLNSSTWLGADYAYSRIRQNRTPVRTVYDPEDYDAEYTWEDSEANLSVLPGARATRQDVRLRLSRRFESGSSLAGSLGVARYNLDPNSDWGDYVVDFDWDERETKFTEIIGDLAYSWYPSDKVGMSAYYAHDLLSVAYELVKSDSVGFSSRWKISDPWFVDIRGQYSLYNDDNAMYQFGVDSFWQVYSEYDLWFGLQYAMATTSDYNPYYWTPYWDERANAVFRYSQAHPGYVFTIDFIFGRQREGKRMQEYNDWGTLYGESSDWGNAWGAAVTYQRKFKKHWQLGLDARTMFLRSYADHSFYLSLDHTF